MSMASPAKASSTTMVIAKMTSTCPRGWSGRPVRPGRPPAMSRIS
jgi:hypothetical protein